MRKDKFCLSNIFLVAALFFAFSSFFGVYERTIYDEGYFLLFWVLEILFWLGLKSGGLVLRTGRQRQSYTFHITEFGRHLLLILNLLSILSFVYFLYLYARSVGISFDGAFTAKKFQEDGRTALEQVTLMCMQLGGDATFLVLSCDKDFSDKRQKRLATFCLFLPGIRYLLMGARYAIACEALIFLIVYRDTIKQYAKRGLASRRSKWLVGIFLVALFCAFMYLFSTRASSTALQKYEFIQGDLQLKTFWKNLYEKTDGKIDFLCSFSDYMAESPYVFSYYCKYGMPEKSCGGVLFLRPIIKILSALAGTDWYDSITSVMMTGKYSGCFYSIICDFGLAFSPIATYLYGLLFAKIERNKNRSRLCAALMPAVMVMCLFAPVYYFNVGRLDFTVFFVFLLSPLCLKKKKMREE